MTSSLHNKYGELQSFMIIDSYAYKVYVNKNKNELFRQLDDGFC
jgi:hypothetical protein